MFFYGTSHIAGESGTIDVSSDGGQTWAPIMTTSSADIDFCPVIAVSDADTVFVTTVDSGGVRDPASIEILTTRIERVPECS